jgi:hypothetical protein
MLMLIYEGYNVPKVLGIDRSIKIGLSYPNY